MHNLTINSIRYAVPGSWNELNQKQLLCLVDMYDKQYNLAEISVKLLLIITGLKVVFENKYEVEGFGRPSEEYVFRHGEQVFIICLRDIIHVASSLGFLFKIDVIEGRKCYSLNSKISKNLLPVIKFGLFRTWYGPSEGLKNLTFAEFIHAETAYYGIIKDESQVNRLIAILYRRRGKYKESSKKYRGDLREEFNDFHIERNARIASRIPDKLKTAILLYYEGCRYAITKIFPEVFSGSGSTPSNSDTFRSYMNLVESLSNFDITKKERIRNAYLYDVLLTINQSIIRDQDKEKEIKKLKSKHNV